MLMNCHFGRLVLSSLCVGAFGAAGFGWCSFCRLQPVYLTKPLFKNINQLRLFSDIIVIYCENHTIHDHPSYLCCPDVLSTVGDPLLGNGCGSPNHIYILIISFFLLFILFTQFILDIK